MNSDHILMKNNALGWVKPLINDNLDDAAHDLKHCIQERNKDLLASAKQRLGNVQRVLTVIEQYVAAMLTEEMVLFCDFIAEQESAGKKQNDQALELLLKAVLELPNYLEQVQSGRRELPFAILPLLNDIRSTKQQGLFSEKLPFLPDLSMHGDDAEIDAINDHANDASKQLIKKLRPAFQLSLLNVINGNEIDENLKRFERIFDLLEDRSSSEQVARIWWIISALVESVSLRQLDLGVSIKNLLGRVDALFRVLLVIGERGLLKRQPIELIKNFLYYIAQPDSDGPKCQAIKTAYRLEKFLPNETDRHQLLNTVVRPNQLLLKTVLEAVRNDVKTVKKTLKIYALGDLSDVQKLRDIPSELHVISDTFAMIGLAEQHQIIQMQIITVKKILDEASKSVEEKVLTLALELARVEQAIEQMQDRQLQVESKDLHPEDDVSGCFELDKVLVAIVTGLLDDIQKIKSTMLEWIKNPSLRDSIESCVALMARSRSALLMLNKTRAVAVTDALLNYMSDDNIVHLMDVNDQNALLQVVVSLEGYLEALVEQGNDADATLDLAESQLAELSVTANQSGVTNIINDISPNLESKASEVEPKLDEALGAIALSDALPVRPVTESLVVLKPNGDPDILAIYIEEAGEAAANIVRLQKGWLLHPEDDNAVKNIQRAFHIIKSSGRLVGTPKIAEFSWDYEQLLNDVIDQMVLPNNYVIDAVGRAATALLELVNELTTEKVPTSDIPYLRGLARALAESNSPQISTEPTLATNTSPLLDDLPVLGLDTEVEWVPKSASSQDRQPDSEVSADDLLALSSSTAWRGGRGNDPQNSRIGRTNRPIVRAGTTGKLPKRGRSAPKHIKYRP